MKNNKNILLLLIVALLLRLIIAWSPLEWLLRYIVTDDAFYYLKIARNLTSGQGLTFDGINITNGFHPLWMILILPIYAITPDNIKAIHYVLTLCATIDVFSIYILFVLTQKLRVHPVSRWIVCILHAVSPIIYISNYGIMSGLETSLNVFLLYCYLLIYIHIILVADSNLSWKLYVLFGVFSGLLFLSRTDNIILLIVSWLAILIYYIRSLQGLVFLVKSSIITVIVVGYWLLWNHQTFGSIVQVSGKSVPFVTKIYYNHWGVLDYFIQYTKNITDLVFYLSGILRTSKNSSVFFILLLIFLIFCVLFVWSLIRNTNNNAKEQLIYHFQLWLAPTITIPLYILVHTLRAIHLRPWYSFSVYPMMIIGLAILVSFIISSRYTQTFEQLIPKIKLLLPIGILIYVLSIPVLFSDAVGQFDKYQIVQAMEEKLPPGARVGCWNAGVVGYFYTKGTVINLDGLVNNKAFSYISQYSLKEYVLQENIEYIVDVHNTDKYWTLYQPVWDKNNNSNITDDLLMIYSEPTMAIYKIKKQGIIQ